VSGIAYALRRGQETITLDKDMIVASAVNAIGKLTGDAKLHADGKADKSEGKFQTPSTARGTRW
jgi:hypothetical protein